MKHKTKTDTMFLHKIGILFFIHVFAPKRKNTTWNIACLSNVLFNFDWFLHVWCKKHWVCLNSVFHAKPQKIQAQ